MSQHTPGFDGQPDPDQELSTISYQAVRPGLPVVTHSGEQFGVVEHVLQVPELDLFDGIVVYTRTGLGAIHPHGGQRAETIARAEMLQLGPGRSRRSGMPGGAARSAARTGRGLSEHQHS